MPAVRTLRGTLRQYERPVWQPLLDLVGEELVEWFMWMHEIELADGNLRSTRTSTSRRAGIST